MNPTIARVPTEHASRYLQQLCKHWSHKFPVDFSDEKGLIVLPLGRCDLTAAAHELTVKLTPETEDTDVAAFRNVVEAHLKRFGFREALAFDWDAREAVAA